MKTLPFRVTISRDHIGKEIQDSLPFILEFILLKMKAKLRLLTQIDLKHTICIKLLYLENPDYSLNLVSG